MKPHHLLWLIDSTKMQYIIFHFLWEMGGNYGCRNRVVTPQRTVVFSYFTPLPPPPVWIALTRPFDFASESPLPTDIRYVVTALGREVSEDTLSAIACIIAEWTLANLALFFNLVLWKIPEGTFNTSTFKRLSLSLLTPRNNRNHGFSQRSFSSHERLPLPHKSNSEFWGMTNDFYWGRMRATLST